jgi:small neutral amino acid transporter SnatA (MarC family)
VFAGSARPPACITSVNFNAKADRWRNTSAGAENLRVVVTVILAAIVGVCLTLFIVGWVARRLGLPIQETLAWFGLLEHPLLPDQ